MVKYKVEQKKKKKNGFIHSHMHIEKWAKTAQVYVYHGTNYYYHTSLDHVW